MKDQEGQQRRKEEGEKKKGVFVRVVDYCRWLYLQYALVTSVYMLNPGEVYVFNGLVLSIIAMACYSFTLFLRANIYYIARAYQSYAAPSSPAFA